MLKYLREGISGLLEDISGSFMKDFNHFVERELVRFRRKIIKELSLLAMFFVSIVFLCASAVLFLIDFVKVGRAAAFLIVGILFLIVGILIKAMR